MWMCNVTHFKWFFLSVFVLLITRNRCVFQCCSGNRVGCSTARTYTYLKQDAPNKNKPDPNGTCSPACCLSFFCHFKRGWLPSKRKRKGWNRFLYSPIVLRAAIVKLIHLNIECYNRKATQEWHQICAKLLMSMYVCVSVNVNNM